MAIESSAGGYVLRTPRIAHRPWRQDPKAPGVRELQFQANRPGRRGDVFVVLVLGRVREAEDVTKADLVRAMDELGWKPKPGYLHTPASDEEAR